MKTNKEIRAPKVRLIGKEGDQIGIVSNLEAQAHAQREGLDLVEISPEASPPVCKVIDYGKLCYEMTKKKRDNRKKENKKGQHQSKLKEIKIRPNIDKHDLEVKIKKIRECIEQGYKVRVTCMLRGRELARPEFGQKVVNKVVECLEETAQLEAPPKQIGKNYSLVLAPLKKKK